MYKEQPTQSIMKAFLRVAGDSPASIAVAHKFSGEWTEVSYTCLLEQARSIAGQLHQLGVKEGDAVILPAIRGPNLCSQILGILWVGAHYVFIDPEYPPERQEYICHEVDARIGLFDNHVAAIRVLPVHWHHAVVDDSPAPPIVSSADNPAYVMFTSGSTGTPKGVVVPHRAVHRLVCNTDFIDFSEKHVFLQLSALGFDASTLELWGPLLNGGTCVLYPESGVITPAQLTETIESRGVTTLWLTSSLYNLVVSAHVESLKSIRQLLIGGEVLSVSHVRLGLENLPETLIYNGYGPTENTTFTTVYPIPRTLPEDIKRIPIGFPIRGTACDIFDENLQPVSDSASSGELIAFGEGLALGYLNRPDITAERFIDIKCRDGKIRRGYRTGDLVLANPDGSYEYLARNDKQVKIDGHRIEPGEIELFLNEMSDIEDARVLVSTGPKDQKRLTAYFVANNEIDKYQLRSRLAEVFPRYMVPHFIVPLERMPINQNGKLDESGLPDPFTSTSEDNTGEYSVASCWEQILGRKVGLHENFLDAGGTSLEAVMLSERLEDIFHTTLGPTFVFEHSTIAVQTRFLEGQNLSRRENTPLPMTDKHLQAGFAVVGMSCRFPGASNVDEFWQNLVEGKETISFFSDSELSDEVSPEDRNHPNYVRAKGIIDGCDQFDAAFFGISPIEASIMDPQQRLMLQLTWHALEDAGMPPGDEQYRTGVFVGSNWARYFQQYVLPNKALLDRYGQFNASLVNEADFLSTRLSYKLNLTGPSVNVFTACSTGLVAITQACASIAQGQCEVAIAGGISVSTPVRSGYLYQEGGMLSRDGHCRPFDADATGTTFNDGAGVIVLKRLDLAEKDGDRIYAKVIGFAVNNDGESKASYTAPSIGGQVAVYQSAIDNANIDPQTIGFIETHGTATPLGDPIEVEALKRVYGYGQGTNKSCALGSVKSNIGHTIHAAGIASFIKTVYAVQKNKIPATLFFENPNPKLDFNNSHFHVNNRLDSWKIEGPRRAAVSSLGVGGTNAHVILEEYTRPVSDSVVNPGVLGHSLLLSAKSPVALSQQLEQYRSYFVSDGDNIYLPDAAYTSVVGRKEFTHRAVICGHSAIQLGKNFPEDGQIIRAQADLSTNKKIGYLFTGQGSQRAQMGFWLYQNHPGFRQLFDRGSDIILAQEGIDIREIIFAEPDSHQSSQISQTQIAQPALFLLEYGLASLLRDHGCNPDFLIGHSIGEYAAAVLAGVVAFEDAVKIVARRGSLMQSMPPGKMLVLKNKSRQEAEEYLDGDICLAASNAPSLTVVAGPTENITHLMQDLHAKGVQTTLLETSHAFHSGMMEPIVSEFEKHIESFELRPPSIPIFATSTGELLKSEQAMSAGFWASQVRNPVLFTDAILSSRKYFPDDSMAYVEVGPGQALTTLMSMQVDSNTGPVISVLPQSGCSEHTISDFQACLGSLWVHGFDINWLTQFAETRPKKVSVPNYAFLKDSFWLEAQPGNQAQPSNDLVAPFVNIAQTILQAPTQEPQVNPEQHLQSVQQEIRDLIEDITGYDLSDLDIDTNFGEAGLDSLLLTQVATAIDRKFNVGITFRHLVEEYTSLAELGAYMAEKITPKSAPVVAASPVPVASVGTGNPISVPTLAGANSSGLQALVNAQLQIMQLQLQAFGNSGVATSQISTVPETPESALAEPQKGNEASSPEVAKSKPRHTPGTRITREIIGAKLSNAQQDWVEKLLAQYQSKFAGSKEYTQRYRKHLADPRTVSGFNPEWKEIVFPIVTKRSKGSKLWDIDGNQLIDTSNGFGPIFFGHSPDFLVAAVKEQLDQGIETGPQSPLAGDVAELFCELTGYDRCTFASTGSEAVAGAIRIARTVTGRPKMAMFEGSYHGIFDEVVVRPGRDYQALPAAPGIPRESTSNMVILPWGEAESLEILKEMGPDLAGVLVESVQSRMPEFHDEKYLQSIREITNESGTAMILDEVVTGFRVHPGGIGRYFKIDADMATFGKVVGGGYPIGIIGGKSKYMDALDGGSWQYGDDSIPECGVTFFAGTFVRHPVALVAAKAIMERIKSEGESLYQDLANKTTKLASEARSFVEEMNCDVKFEEFASFFYVSVPSAAHWGHLLFTMMNLEGIHIQQYRPNFLTTTHSQTDIESILGAFKKSLAQLVQQGLIEGNSLAASKFLQAKPGIPVGARLGKNINGEPAYFIEDPENKGQYKEVGNS